MNEEYVIKRRKGEWLDKRRKEEGWGKMKKEEYVVKRRRVEWLGKRRKE